MRQDWAVALMTDEQYDETGAGRCAIPAAVRTILSTHTTAAAAANRLRRLPRHIRERAKVIYHRQCIV